MERPSNRSFKLRGARITQAQATAIAKYGESYLLPTDQPFDPRELFPGQPVIMEIGTGMGEATAQIALSLPETGFIGVEVHRPGIGALLARIAQEEISNLRLIREDAHIVLGNLIPDKSLDAIHLYFPDPWPKSKHWKRRIIQSEFLELVSRKIKKGGYVHIATDWVPYAEWIQKHFASSELFEGGEISKPEFRPETRFEGQGIKKGHRVTDLLYRVK